ncbi:hypothetical protein L2729_12740 [Shewanella gelidimarina]|uniref:hypothetical protein n=1 Tax=Shewanella gelidimarina TaxID=56813 RepID=UPI0020100075|nr:hypothetical protein [Shewanella gelidimarina]MCL1058848.1 hypothetical protein [Shewanella gelidimarina]
MKHPKVKSLFKYCSIGKNQMSALAQRKIWYSKPAGFNDPFDTRFYVTGKLRAFITETDPSKIKVAFDGDMSDAILFNRVSLQDEMGIFEKEIEELGILSCR